MQLIKKMSAECINHIKQLHPLSKVRNLAPSGESRCCGVSSVESEKLRPRERERERRNTSTLIHLEPAAIQERAPTGFCFSVRTANGRRIFIPIIAMALFCVNVWSLCGCKPSHKPLSMLCFLFL